MVVVLWAQCDPVTSYGVNSLCHLWCMPLMNDRTKSFRQQMLASSYWALGDKVYWMFNKICAIWFKKTTFESASKTRITGSRSENVDIDLVL